MYVLYPNNSCSDSIIQTKVYTLGDYQSTQEPLSTPGLPHSYSGGVHL